MHLKNVKSGGILLILRHFNSLILENNNNSVAHSKMTILPCLSAISQALSRPPSTLHPSIRIVSIPANTIVICTVSAHSTAFIPPYTTSYTIS